MRRLGDRRDGTLIRDIDAMHYVMPLMYPNRCDNEAYITMEVELAGVEQYIKEQNAGRSDEDRLSLFGIMIAASLKTIHDRPHMNRFIANQNIYQRNHISAAFTVKKEFSDEGDETLARIVACDDDNLDSIQRQVNEQIRFCKTQDDESTEAMNFIKKLPFKHFIGRVARWADRHGWMPKSVIATDPYQCSVVLTNLGSIGMNIGYHHLMNWGTNSVFIEIGEKVYRPVLDNKGNSRVKKVIKLSFTIDERISDGYYYAKSLRLLKRLVENPELLQEKFGN